MDDNISSLFQKITQQEYLKVKIKEELEYNNYIVLSDVGVHRIVFKSPNNTVIKVARNNDEIDQNYDEAAIWSQKKDKNVFCPVINTCPHHTWIEMKYCNPAPNEIKTYKEKLDNYNYSISDLHPDNIGRINDESNNLVCFDYPDMVDKS